MFQNSFCFCSTTIPSAVRKIFGLKWEFQWENNQKIIIGNKIWQANLAIYDHTAIGPCATNMGKQGIPEKNFKNVAQQC